jgi:hypothetical protein
MPGEKHGAWWRSSRRGRRRPYDASLLAQHTWALGARRRAPSLLPLLDAARRYESSAGRPALPMLTCSNSLISAAARHTGQELGVMRQERVQAILPAAAPADVWASGVKREMREGVRAMAAAGAARQEAGASLRGCRLGFRGAAAWHEVV